MKEKILQLKKLNAAYIAALEYDYCPGGGSAESVWHVFEPGIEVEPLREALNENEGRRPDEIASTMSDLIKIL